MTGQVYSLNFQIDGVEDTAVEIEVNITVNRDKVVLVDEISDIANQVAMELDSELKSITKQ